jgi:hypothetical protein
MPEVPHPCARHPPLARHRAAPRDRQKAPATPHRALQQTLHPKMGFFGVLRFGAAEYDRHPNRERFLTPLTAPRVRRSEAHDPTGLLVADLCIPKTTAAGRVTVIDNGVAGGGTAYTCLLRFRVTSSSHAGAASKKEFDPMPGSHRAAAPDRCQPSRSQKKFVIQSPSLREIG